MSHITAELMGFFNDMKTCTKCKIEKEFSEFSKDKTTKDGYKYICKSCYAKYRKENKTKINEQNAIYILNNPEKRKDTLKKYYIKNKEEILQYKKQWHLDNPEYRKKYYIDNKKEINKNNKKYCIENKEKMIDFSKQYYIDNKIYILDYQKQYALENKDKIKQYQKKYALENKENRNKRERERKLNDPLFKLIHDIRNLIGISIKGKGYTKKSKTHQILGCSFEKFKQHLESQFTEGMTWENQGEWHMDHIYPVSRATDEQHLIKLNHYTNFQPLWAEDNLKKGNKINTLN